MHVTRGRCLLGEMIAKKGWTQAEYARRSGRPKRIISHFCNNERVMKPEDEYMAALLLDVRMEDLHEWIIEKKE
ncbi:helix-turn-helix domain-containing protein [Paenibacillus sp. ACRRX]|uniref:helix-turn-helix domain-containing protein n=1 Tax=Paenibacillus sp. ACRRX TaxID=2918206 RepID=UPI001EF6F52A|nr:helix-turn-helix transcriptional regulator [Paenibacillus sp. ACRRX]MCG7406810.1 helix-turn-helix domain-containing protein [Paenibacillus sp. ACRRX]